jgi:Transposase DDE domain group 1
VVTSLSAEALDARALYEVLYCGRGDMENRIKEQQLALFADRTSTHEIRSNQLRLYFSSFAYVLMQTLRRLGLRNTSMAKAQCDTIRLKLFKIGAQIRVSVRRVWIAFSKVIRLPNCSGRSCSGCNKYCAANLQAQPMVGAIAFVCPAQEPLCPTLKKSSEMTLPTDPIGDNRFVSTRTRPARRPQPHSCPKLQP